MELEAAGSDREAILLGYHSRTLERSEELFCREAKRLGLTDDTSDVLARVQEQRRGLENYRRSKSIGKLGKFGSEKNAAPKLNRQDDLWTFLLSHGMVHGEEAAYLFRRRKVGADAMAFLSHTTDPDLLAEVGLFAARSLSHAVYAVADIFGWTVSPELPELVEDLECRVNHS
jgi:hypothetical protein